MKYLRTIFLLGLLSLLFVGNIGVNVFKHVCSEEGVSVSYLVNRGSEHCANHAIQQELPPCCHSEEKKKKDDCCSDEVLYFKIHIDAEQHVLPHFDFDAQAVVPDEIEWCDALKYVEQEVALSYITPPPPDGREILLFKQVWII